MSSKLPQFNVLRFSLENYRSFRDRADLSFEATSRKDEPQYTIGSKHTKHGILPTLGVWGANASGKSNLLGAISFLRSVVLNSHNSWRPTDPVPSTPWRLREGQGPTTFELEFLLDGTRYLFGFSVSRGVFVEEKLFRWEGAKRQVLYFRNVESKDPWYFGPHLRGQRVRISNSTRANSLFLSAAAQENHPVLLPIYDAIARGIKSSRRVELHGFPAFDAEHPILQEAYRPQLVGLLAASDIGISGVQVRRHDNSLPDEYRQLFTEGAYAKLRRPREELREVHLTRGDDEPWTLPPQDESAGTNILLARFADAVAVLSTGGLWIVDELDSSLHSDLCVALVGLFTNARSNPVGAQLLFSTHDRDVLGALRTDEVYLVSKAYDCSSSLAAASEYRGIRSREDLRRVHTEGRLRGVPILGDLASIVSRGN